MKEAVHAKPLKTGDRVIDPEHNLQLQLIHLPQLRRPCVGCRAIRWEKRRASSAE